MLRAVFAGAGLIGCIMTVQTAVAADLPVKAPAAVVAPAYNWSGFYAGVNVGYGWGSNGVTYAGGSSAARQLLDAFGPFFDPFSSRSRGAVGGGQIGYNWQIHPRWLAGLEADFDLSGLRGGTTVATGFNTGVLKTADSNLDWFGTVRARLGATPFDRVLVYGTGGLAYGQTKLSGRFDAVSSVFSGTNPSDRLVCNTANCIFGSSSKVSAGWTAGGGVEYAFRPNATIRAEYLFLDLGDRTIRLFNPPNSGFIDINVKQHYNVVRAALNVKF